MTTSNDVSMHLAHYRPIIDWKPMVGDIVTWHGWIQHWFGIISSVGPDKVQVVKAGLPKLLVTMNSIEVARSIISIDIDNIRASRGAYAALRPESGKTIWYV